MEDKTKIVEGKKTLENPFNKDGSPTLVTSILATLLPNIPLSKEALLGRIGEQHTGKTRGYLSNHFSELSKQKIIRFIKRDGTWTQGEGYQTYMGFVFMEMIRINQQAIDGLKYRLMPKRDMQSVDFITSPQEDIFSRPNQFIEEEKPKKKKTLADDYL